MITCLSPGPSHKELFWNCHLSSYQIWWGAGAYEKEVHVTYGAFRCRTCCIFLLLLVPILSQGTQAEPVLATIAIDCNWLPLMVLITIWLLSQIFKIRHIVHHFAIFDSWYLWDLTISEYLTRESLDVSLALVLMVLMVEQICPGSPRSARFLVVAASYSSSSSSWSLQLHPGSSEI